MLLKNKVVVVTGGAGLIGREIVKAIAQNGGLAVIADIDKTAAELAVSEISEETHGNELHSIELDITQKDSISSLKKELTKRFGRIDALINNAYPRNNNYGRLFEDVEYEDFCENMDLHLGGYFLMSQQISEYFKTQGHGNIINVSSVYGIVAPRFDIYAGTEMTMPIEYAVIKSAIIHMTRYMARYYRNQNIRFNTISLGGILDKQPETFIRQYDKYSLNKGMLDRKDVVGTIVFLLSDLSTYVNGQNIVVDDGWSL